MGVLTAFVGFASSFAVVLHGLTGRRRHRGAGGVRPDGAVDIDGLCAIVLSLSRRDCRSAWPGRRRAGAARGKFRCCRGRVQCRCRGRSSICGAADRHRGLWKPLGRAVAAIPAPLANAMLAGVLIGLCFAPVKAVGFNPLLGLPIVLAWIVVGASSVCGRCRRPLAAFVLVVVFGVDVPEPGRWQRCRALAGADGRIRHACFQPRRLSSSIALPLFIVTMASQNIPGIAVMKVNGYETKPGPLFASTGFFSLLSAPFGGHAVNLAAITAAMCAGPDAHPDPKPGVTGRCWSAASAILSSGRSPAQ
jgi:benzoate membrane transport protein